MLTSLVNRQALSYLVVLGFSGAVLVGCNQNTSQNNGANDQAASSTEAKNASDAKKETIVIGTTEGDFADMVRNQVQKDLEAKGYKVKLVTFTDYVMPNQALASGDLDINIFQHKPYLDTFKAEHNLDLVEVFQVPTAPLGLYAGKQTKLDGVHKGVSIAVPNDPSNFARALVILSDLGWLKLKDGIDPLKASKADIADNSKYDIKLIELEAAQLPRARDEADFAIINGNFATDNGIKLTDALYQEKSFAYVNWSAIKTADKDKPWVKDVTDAYNSDSFKKYAHATFPGYKYPKIWGESENTPEKNAAATPS